MSRHQADDNGKIDSAATLDVTETGLADQARTICANWGASRFRSVRKVCDDVRLVIEFVDRLKKDAGALRVFLAEDDAYRAAIGTLRQAVRTVFGTVQQIDGNEQDDRGGRFEKLFSDADQLLAGLSAATAALRKIVLETAGIDQKVRDRAQRFVDAIDDELAARGSVAPEKAWARRVVDSMTRLNEEARRLYDEQRGTAGRIGAESLGHAYDMYAKRERRNATALRWLVGVLAAGIAALALWFHHAVSEVTLVLELARLSATVPLGLLAVYLARESTRHRTAARRARELAIALHTVDDYTAKADPEDRRALRQALGMRAFGAPADATAVTPSDPDLLRAVLTKLTETVSIEVLDRLGLAGKGEKGGVSGETKPDSHKS